MQKKFEEWDEAFAYCREVNHPVLVQVKGKNYKIFPSGRCEDRPERSKS